MPTVPKQKYKLISEKELIEALVGQGIMRNHKAARNYVANNSYAIEGKPKTYHKQIYYKHSNRKVVYTFERELKKR